MPETMEITKKLENLADVLVKWREQADKELKATGEVSKTVSDSVKKLETELSGMKVIVEKMQLPGGDNRPQTRKSIGTQFIESKAYKDMVAAGEIKSAPFEVKDIVASRLIDTVSGMPVQAQVIPGVIQEPEPELRVVDLINQANTDSNAIYYVKGTYTKAAAPKKESKQGTLIDKPEATLVFAPATETVKTIPVWIPATRQILSDAPALRALIDQNLLYDVRYQQEYQVLFGNGTDPQLNGITPQATAYDDTLPTQLGLSTVTRIDHLRAAILQARQARYPVTGLVLNPFDWAAIELTKDSTYKYIWVSVNDGGVARMWRVPVVESDMMSAGYFLAGAFRQGATLYNREGATIRVSESHDKYFVENMVAILCELRCALVVTRPQAFIYGQFEESGS